MTTQLFAGADLPVCLSDYGGDLGGALDIGPLRPHTLSMLSCHRSVISRALPLLGLVLLLVLVAGAVLADNGYGYIVDGANTTFPYLSPIKEQRNVIFNAFGFQMLLFGGINGTGVVAVKALNYLAMTAVLVGALMIIFNAKYRKVDTLVPWLLLVIITIFAPYGSQLLFTPLAKNVKYGLGGESKQINNCIDRPDACGFAPQVLGIHIASLLQLTFSDLFNSHQWKGLIQQSNSTTNLLNDPKLVASPEWLPRVKDFNDKCGSRFDWDALISYRLNGKKVTDVPDMVVPQTLSSEWAKFKAPYMSENSGKMEIYPPRAIRLYDESDYPGGVADTIGPNTADNQYWQLHKADYEAGLTKLYKAVTDDTDHRVVLKSSGESDQILASAALAKLDSYSFFTNWYGVGNGALTCTVSNRCGMMPGFLFVWKGAGDGKDAALYRACYNAGTKNLVNNVQETWCGIHSPQDQASDFRKFLTNSGARLLGGYEGDQNTNPMWGDWHVVSGTPWEGLIKNDLFSDPDIMKMPVGVITYAMANPLTETRATVISDEPMMSCLAEGDRLMNEAISWTLGSAGKAKQLENLRKILAGKAVPAKSTTGDPAPLTTLTMDQIYNTDTTCSGVTCAYPSDELLADNVIKAFDNVERNMETATQTPVLSDEQRFSGLMKLMISSIEAATGSLSESSAAELKAKKDSTAVQLVGNETLTAIGGWGAAFFGSLLTGVGAWLAGPLSAAVVYFLSLLIDMALLILIVLTPIMFVIALAMPGAAMGVMTIAVMGAFILKTVPITLLVLNNIGGMIYTMIGAGAGDNSGVMQNIMILAMAGLYMNLVGMTFFLLFKLGDPATVLSRFTALDGSAKQIADRGMAAAIAAASIAALAVGGGAGAALGWKGAAGMTAAAKKRLAAATGVDPSVINAATNTASQMSKSAIEGVNETKTTDGTPGVEPVSERDETLPAGELALDSKGKPFSPEDMLELNDPDTQDMMTSAVASLDFKNEDGTTDEARIRELGVGRVVTDDNGNLVQKNRVDGIVGYGAPEANAPDVVRTAGQIVNEDMQSVDATINGKAGDVGAALTPGQRQAQQMAERQQKQDEESARRQIAPQQQEQQSPQPGQQNQAAHTPSGDQIAAQRSMQRGGTLQDGQSAAGTGGASQQQVGETAAPGISQQIPADGGQSGAQANLQPGQSGAPVNVNVMNGIDVKSIPTGGQNLEDVERSTVVQAAADERQRLKTIVDDENAKPELRDAAQVAYDQLGDAQNQTKEAVDTISKDFDRTMLANGTSRAEREIVDEARLNLGQQVGAALKTHIKTYGTTAELDQKINEGTATAEEQNARSQRKDLEEFDPVSVIEGQMHSKLAEMKNMENDLKIVGAADMRPGFLKTVASGMYGGLTGAGGGLAKIPVIGSAITEAGNELYQGAERARAWNTSGGFKQWWNDKGAAQRMGFYQKEMAPLGAATQYNAMGAVGGFEGQASLARQAANEAVARTFSQYEAMMANQRGQVIGRIEKSNSDLPLSEQLSADKLQLKIEAELKNHFSSPGFQANMSIEDLKGLGAIEAADRVASVRQEAFTMQHNNLQVMKTNLNDKMMLNTDADGNIDFNDLKAKPVAIQMNADVLNKLRGDLASKKVAGNIDDMMITHYGLMEKQYLRGNADWDATRHMTYDGKSAARFAMQDVSTDYLIGGHIKMVEGKYKYKESQGNYHTLVRMRHEEHGKKDEVIVDMIGKAGGVQTLLTNEGYDFSKEKGKFDNQIRVMRREAMDKMAKSELQKNNQLMPLEAVFDESYMNGLKKYVEKSMLAPLNQGVQNAKITKTVTQGVRDNMKNLSNISESAEIPLELTMPGQGRARMRDSKEKLSEVIVAIAGKNLENIGRVNAVFMEELGKETDAILVDQTDLVNASGLKTGTRGTNAIPEAAFQRIREKLKDNAEFVRSMDDNFKQVNGQSIFSELEFDGKQRLVDDWKNK